MNENNSNGQPPRIHLVGTKNSGKTTLVEALVRELTAQGYRVGTIKHTHHHHELDTPGKDSHRHRESGAAVVGILSPTQNAVFWGPSSSSEESNPYQSFEPMMATCDLILVEGDLHTSACKIEVWREALGVAPRANEHPSIAAIISDDSPGVSIPIWPRSDVATIATNLLKLLGQPRPSA